MTKKNIREIIVSILLGAVATWLVGSAIIKYNKHPDNCSKDIHSELKNGGSIGFMLHGGILDKYEEGRVYISIAKVNDPKDWSFNEYFTGEGFSPNEEDEYKVPKQDSCDLKNLYFEYLKDEK